MACIGVRLLVRLFALVLVCSMIVFIYVSFHSDDFLTKIYRPWFWKIQKWPPSTRKTILFWNYYFDTKDFEFGLGEAPFSPCEVGYCRTTTDRNLLNESDAVVFHALSLSFSDMPTNRMPHQRWIFLVLESPTQTDVSLKNFTSLFNWTMTYRTDSDVYLPYYVAVDPTATGHEPPGMDWQLVDKEFSHFVGSGEVVPWRDFPKNKSKKVAWFVSRCISVSKREKYVAELRKHIEVDIYGKCAGSKKCPRGLQCYHMLEKDYKFYLSFENSLCVDYATEKLQNALLFNVVPVVYGVAKYAKLAPKNSYIDVRNFSSPRHLAEYLNYLDKNDEEYLKYFKWRRTPPGVAALPRGHQPWCNLCRMLHDPTLPAKSYANITAWWFDRGQCGKDRHIFESLLSRND